MSDILAIRDAMAAKVANVAGIKKAYTRMPDAIADGPVAVMVYDGTDVIHPGSFEELEDQYTAEIYVATQSAAFSEATLLPLARLILAEFRTGRMLGGLVAECGVVRIDAIETVDVNGRNYDRLPVRFRVRDAAVVTVGP